MYIIALLLLVFQLLAQDEEPLVGSIKVIPTNVYTITKHGIDPATLSYNYTPKLFLLSHYNHSGYLPF